MAVRTGASENATRSTRVRMSLARAIARVKRTPSGELCERHGRRRNGCERLGEMIEHRMRLAGKATPDTDCRRGGDEAVGVDARHGRGHDSRAAKLADDRIRFQERRFERARAQLGIGTPPSRMRNAILHHCVDRVEHEAERIAPLSRDEARMITMRASVG